MPCPMVHLAVAVKIHDQRQSTPSPDFLLGSIAPDAIHMRAGSGPDDKQRVHFSELIDPQHERLQLLLARSGSSGCSTMGFTEGYVAHILTDHLWGETIGVSFRKRIPPDLPLQERGSLYYLETDQIDMDLYRQVPWRTEVWSKLASTQPRDFTTLLTADEISKWRDRTLAWYEDMKHEPKIKPVYITGEEVNDFINQAVKVILATFTGWNYRKSPLTY